MRHSGEPSPAHDAPAGDATRVDSVVPMLEDRAGRATLMQPGALLAGRYRLVAPIASGGIGRVWLALHLRLGCRVALKVLRRERRDDANLRERFRREALTVAQLRHPGIVRPIDFGTLEDGRDFLAMEFVEGVSLQQALDAHGALPWRTALDAGLEVSEALAFAHAHGVIHRDLKPANLMLEGGLRAGGRVRLLDLGIAHNESLGARTLTQRGTVLGTPSYAAPEQLRGERVEPRSDLYALGVILYRMITGRLPYAGGTFAEVGEAQLAGPPPHPFEVRPDRTRPPGLDDLVMRLLRYRVDERIEGASDLHQALAALLSEDDETVRYRSHVREPLGAGPRLRLRTIFLTGVAGAAAGFTVACAIGFVLMYLLGS